MEKKEEKFWQVFTRDDNKPVLAILVALVIVAVIMWARGEDQPWIPLVIAAVVLAVDAVSIYRGLNKNR